MYTFLPSNQMHLHVLREPSTLPVSWTIQRAQRSPDSHRRVRSGSWSISPCMVGLPCGRTGSLAKLNHVPIPLSIASVGQYLGNSEITFVSVRNS